MSRTITTALAVAALLLSPWIFNRDVKPDNEDALYLQDDMRDGCPECEPRGQW